MDMEQEDQPSPDIRRCRICMLYKEPKYFVKSKAFKSGYDTICLNCSREKVKLWRKANPEKRKEQLKREVGKDYNHNKHLKSSYGITRQEYLVMFNLQNGCCKICNAHQSELNKRLFVDHCHITGKIRGLLCHHCNSMLGYSKDRIDLLKAGIKYLKEYNGSD